LSKNETLGTADAEAGALTVSLREELTGIQYGTVEDRHNWMVKLS
jgi:branched-chain amino acid aminotransferase